MSKLNHTPGPWQAIEHESGWWSVLQGAWDISHNQAATSGTVASACYSSMSPRENEANARLIAAAPEMYKLLRLAATGEQIRIAAGDLIRKLEAQDS